MIANDLIRKINAEGDVVEQVSMKEKENEELNNLLNNAEINQQELMATILTSWKTIWDEYQDLSRENAEVHQKLEYITEDLSKAKQDMSEIKLKQQVRKVYE